MTFAALLMLPGSARAYIFWTNEHSSTIGRDTNDGNPANINQTFTVNANNAKGVAIDGNYIYWANWGGNSIGRASLDGSPASINPNFITGSSISDPEGIAIDSNYVYWANNAAGSGTTIGRAPITGGPNTAQTFITGASDPVGVALDNNGNIYWTNFTAGTIGQASLNNPSSPNQTWLTVPSLDGSPAGVMVYGSSIYWTGIAPGGIGQVDSASLPTGLNLQALVTGATFPLQVATDGTYLYWTNRSGNNAMCLGQGTGTCTIGRANLNGTGPNQNFIAGAGADTIGSPDTVWGLAVGLPPASLAGPAINGSPVGGSTLAAVAGTWSNSPTTFSHQWLRCDSSGANCTPVSGATRQTYVLGPGDVGSTIRVQETATNLMGGPSSPAISVQTGVVTPPLSPSNVTSPSIQGSAVQGQTLTEAHDTWVGTLSYVSFQWLRCGATGQPCAPISGATGQAYTLTNADVGSSLRVQEIATDVYGNSGSSTSAPSGVVAPLRPTVVTVVPTGRLAALTLGCAGPGGQTCDGSVTASALEQRLGRIVIGVGPARSKQRVRVVTVTVGKASFTIPAGDTTTVHLSLNGLGSGLLSSFYKLPATLAFTDSAVGQHSVKFAYPLTTPSLLRGGWGQFVPYWRVSPYRYTTLFGRFVVPISVARATITVRCAGSGCPSGHTIPARKPSLDLTAVLNGRRLAVGAILTIIVTAPESVGRILDFKMRPDDGPLESERCLPPGVRRPVKCAA